MPGKHESRTKKQVRRVIQELQASRYSSGGPSGPEAAKLKRQHRLESSNAHEAQENEGSRNGLLGPEVSVVRELQES